MATEFTFRKNIYIYTDESIRLQGGQWSQGDPLTVPTQYYSIEFTWAFSYRLLCIDVYEGATSWLQRF